MTIFWRLSFLLLLPVLACSPAQRHQASGPARPEWGQKQHDLGEIPFGVAVAREFLVRNAGGEPLLIREAKPTCHCLSTDWTREAILGGQTGLVRITFDAAKEGEFYRVVPVTTSADVEGEQPAALVIKGIVQPKPAPGQ